MITEHEASVMAHTANTGRYVTDEAAVIEMGVAGFLTDHGPQSLAGGMHYFTLSPMGREALEEWKAAQPKPSKPKRRRATPAFESWRTYCDVWSRIPFSEFLKKVWPMREGFR